MFGKYNALKWPQNSLLPVFGKYSEIELTVVVVMSVQWREGAGGRERPPGASTSICTVLLLRSFILVCDVNGISGKIACQI